MKSNDELIDYLKRKGYIKTERVEKAFRKVDRADFVPKDHIDSAYDDRPLPLKTGSTISAPHMVAINTELLLPEKDSRVLEMGSGSGYQLAILSELSDEVIGIEIEQELVESSGKVLASKENIEIQIGDSLDAAKGSFDRILYSYAVKNLEEARTRLETDGVIVAPIECDGSQDLMRYQNGDLTEHGGVRFVRKK